MRSPSLDPPSEPRSTAHWTTVLAVALTLLVSAYAMSPNVADPDLWGHVQFGREVLAEGAIPETNSYAFTARDFRWINHENLSELVMAWTVDTWGNAGLLWGKLALSLLVLGILLGFNLRQGVALVPSCLLTILVAWNLGYHWSFRPQISSFVLFTLLVLVLQTAFAGWRGNWRFPGWRPNWAVRGAQPDPIPSATRLRWLWCCPLILLVWANSHGGYVAGVCVLLAYLGSRAFEAFNEPAALRTRLWLRMGLVGLACILATLVNPYSWRLPMWLLESLGEPRPEILDWSQDQLWGLVGFKFWVLVATGLFAVIASRRSLDFTQALLLAITLWQAYSHFRHVPFFAILAGFWLGPHLQSGLARFQGAEAAEWSFRSPWARAVAALLWVSLFGLVGVRMAERLNHVRVERDVFPVDAFEFMSQHGIGGRLVVTYDWAQYAIHAFSVDAHRAAHQPATYVAFDGRFRTCYPQQLVDMHFDLLFGDHTPRHRSPESPPIDPTRVLEYGTPDLVLVRRRGEWSAEVMESQQESWTLLYEDPLAQLWGRASRYDEPSSPHFLAPHRRVRTDTLNSDYVDWPALPSSSLASSNHP